MGKEEAMHRISQQISFLKGVALLESTFISEGSPCVHEDITSRRYAEIKCLTNRLNNLKREEHTNE